MQIVTFIGVEADYINFLQRAQYNSILVHIIFFSRLKQGVMYQFVTKKIALHGFLF